MIARLALALALALALSGGACASAPSRVWVAPDARSGDRLPPRTHVWVLAATGEEIALARTTLRRAGLRVHPRSRPRPGLSRRLGEALVHAALVHDGGTLDKLDEDFAPLRSCLQSLITRAGGARPPLLGLLVVHRLVRPAFPRPGRQRVDLAASLFHLGHGRLIALASRSYESRPSRRRDRRELGAALLALARAVRPGRWRAPAAPPVAAPFVLPAALPPQR